MFTSMTAKFKGCNTLDDVANRILRKPMHWRPTFIRLSRQEYISVLQDAMNNNRHVRMHEGRHVGLLHLVMGTRTFYLTAGCSDAELLQWYAKKNPTKRALRLGNNRIQLKQYRSK